MQYKKKNMTAQLVTAEIDGKACYLVTTHSTAKYFKTLSAAETYLIKKGYTKI